MRLLRTALIVILSAIFLPLCVSTPINYDTAQIPDGRTPLRVGVGAHGFKGSYTVCGSPYNYTGGTVRGDVQVGYGFKRVAEVGLQGGMAVGGYEERREDGTVSDRGGFVQADVYPYLKVGIPGESFRATLKVAAGGGLTTLGSGGAYPMAYADLLFGLGSPERLTFGFRLSPTDGLLAVGSLHFGLYVLSVMAGGDPGGQGATLYVGLGLTR